MPPRSRGPGIRQRPRSATVLWIATSLQFLGEVILNRRPRARPSHAKLGRAGSTKCRRRLRVCKRSRKSLQRIGKLLLQDFAQKMPLGLGFVCLVRGDLARKFSKPTENQLQQRILDATLAEGLNNFLAQSELRLRTSPAKAASRKGFAPSTSFRMDREPPSRRRGSKFGRRGDRFAAEKLRSAF